VRRGSAALGGGRGRGLGGAALLLAIAGCTDIARDLGVLKVRGSCAAAALIEDLAPGCARLDGRTRVAAPLDPGAAAAAFDGDVCRTWNSGRAAPAWIGVDLGGGRMIGGVILVPGGEGSAGAAHVVETSEDGETFEPRVVLTGSMAPARGHAVQFDPPIEARHVRVSTTGAGRVVWREIIPLGCGG
jgi:hypothetical protein